MKKSSIFKKARYIICRLKNKGFKAYIVGGAVRDMIMGAEPDDYDIVTDASPDVIAGMFKKTYPVGAEFGVTLVILGKKSFEVAQFRKDGIYEDGRRPLNIEPAAEIEDICRRDFTINALLYDPDDMKIYDYAGGKDDIEKKIIRTVGDPFVRFGEDRLRMLRAVRFSVRFGFEIEPRTLTAIKENAYFINDVSPERIGDELSKMLTGNHPGEALRLLDETGLLKEILPEISAMKGVEQPPQFHPEGDVFCHTLLMFENFRGGSVELAFGILLHDVAKPLTISHEDRIRFNLHDEIGAETSGIVMRRLRFPRDTVTKVQWLVKNHMKFNNVPKMRESTLKRFILQDGFDKLLELHRLDCLASHKNLEIYELIKNEIMKMQTENIYGLPKPFLNGDDLKKLGYEPGRVFAEILNRLLDLQIEGAVKTKKEAVNSVLSEFPLKLHRQNPEKENNCWGQHKRRDTR